MDLSSFWSIICLSLFIVVVGLSMVFWDDIRVFRCRRQGTPSEIFIVWRQPHDRQVVSVAAQHWLNNFILL